jgi:hypothetical protein
MFDTLDPFWITSGIILLVAVLMTAGRSVAAQIIIHNRGNFLLWVRRVIFLI